MTSIRATFAQAAELRAQTERLELEQLLSWALKTYGDKLVLASSFGPEDMVLIDALASIATVSQQARVISLDTGRLPEPTYALMDQTRERYPQLQFELYFPDPQALDALVKAQGVNGFYQSVEARRRCCDVRKVAPLGQALSGAASWITGMRREQSPTRSNLAHLELDLANGGLIKLNPLLEWTQAQVWARIRERELPYNALHDQGYPSIGCAPCTRAVAPGEDARAGRWWWEQPDQKECGLHVHKAT